MAENESVCGAEAGESAATEELPSDDAHERLIAMICGQWNGRGTCAAVDAVQDLLVETEPEFCAPVIRAICRLSRSWTEQIASDLLEGPNEVSGDFLGLAKALEASTPSKNQEVENDHAKMP